jgi:hypothetical protein
LEFASASDLCALSVLATERAPQPLRLTKVTLFYQKHNPHSAFSYFFRDTNIHFQQLPLALFHTAAEAAPRATSATIISEPRNSIDHRVDSTSYVAQAAEDTAKIPCEERKSCT